MLEKTEGYSIPAPSEDWKFYLSKDCPTLDNKPSYFLAYWNFSRGLMGMVPIETIEGQTFQQATKEAENWAANRINCGYGLVDIQENR